jgi:hypothetical protein
MLDTWILSKLSSTATAKVKEVRKEKVRKGKKKFG